MNITCTWWARLFAAKSLQPLMNHIVKVEKTYAITLKQRKLLKNYLSMLILSLASSVAKQNQSDWLVTSRKSNFVPSIGLLPSHKNKILSICKWPINLSWKIGRTLPHWESWSRDQFLLFGFRKTKLVTLNAKMKWAKNQSKYHTALHTKHNKK